LRCAYYTAWIGISRVAPGEWPYDTGHTVAFLGDGLRFCASTMAAASRQRQVYWYASEARSDPERLEEFRTRRLFALFREKSPEVANVMERALEPYPEAFPIKDRAPSWQWGRGAVALLGDAAHAAAPDLGQGACQALESAVVMAEELARCGDVATAFAGYARRRMDRTARITTMSRVTAIMSMARGPGVDLARELAIRALLPAIPPGEFDRLFCNDSPARR
jgi:2-polyprenyl-6-methoxyphenol hydroxylase-like FAD-dependent oxidoreductase